MTTRMSPITAWNSVAALSIVLLVSAFVADRLLPAPSLKTTPPKRAERERAAISGQGEQVGKLEAARGSILEMAWSADGDTVQSASMALASKLARETRVSLNAFRPQKPTLDGEIERIPFILSLEGRYLNLIEFVRKLETPSNRISVNLVQFTSSDGATDNVTATIAVFAFRDVPRQSPKPPAAPTGSMAARTTEST